jgi:hypothetical protein
MKVNNIPVRIEFSDAAICSSQRSQHVVTQRKCHNSYITNRFIFQFFIFAALFAVAAAGTYKTSDYVQSKYEAPAKPDYVSVYLLIMLFQLSNK